MCDGQSGAVIKMTTLSVSTETQGGGGVGEVKEGGCVIGRRRRMNYSFDSPPQRVQ